MAEGTSSNKEIKSALKNAREAIRNKEYKEALKHCKAVLKLDKNNYNALVFIGKAAEEMGQLDQAVTAYRKAASVDPTQLLAWQGLCSFFEKSENPDHKADLVEVYTNLRDIWKEKEPAKCLDMQQKMIDLYKTLKQFDKACEELIQLVKSGTVQDQRKKSDFQMQLVELLTSEEHLKQLYSEMIEETYQEIINSEHCTTEERKRFHKDFILHLLPRGYEMVRPECDRMHSIHPADPFPMSVLVEFNLQTGTDDLTDDVFICLERLRALEETNPLVRLVEGQTKLYKKDFHEAKEALLQSTRQLSTNPFSWLFLTRCQIQLHENKAVDKTIQEGLKAVKTYSFPGVEKKSFDQEFLFLQAKALLDRGTAVHVTKCLQILQRLLGSDSCHFVSQIKVLQVRAYLALNEMDKSKEVFAEVQNDGTLPAGTSLLLKGQILLAENDDLHSALQCFVTCADSYPEVALSHFLLGKVMWHQRGESGFDYAKCSAALIKAAKIDPNHSDTFLYLGYLYNEVVRDFSQARTCFERAFDLNAESELTGAALGDIYMATGDEVKALALYSAITSQAPAGTAKWAWLRLGLCQLHQGDPSPAIASFQSALRADPKDNHCWECLGEAYMSRGSYTAAMKAFTRGSELGDSPTYCLNKIAAIKQTLGLFAEAGDEYQQVLDSTPDYIPALKGQGETHVSLARAALQQFLNRKAVDYIQKAIGALARASHLRPDLCCLWGLLGDACSLVHLLDDAMVRIPVAVTLLSSKGTQTSDGKDFKIVSKHELLSLGARCYTRALQLQAESASLWSSLGINYYYQSQSSKDNEQMYAAKAFQCLHKAVSFDPAIHHYWTTLGVICSSPGVNKPSVSQHAFIKSIQLEPNNAVAWTNLGTLYLVHGNKQLAHKSFQTAQSLDPNYVNSWIGQAIIAESIGSEEAMDLFRHTTELTMHVEGGLGYAYWVCQTLLDPKLDKQSELYRYNILQMKAVSQASVSIGKYVDRSPENPCALTLHGLLLERQGLHKSALPCFQRCVELLGKVEDSKLLNQAKANYARSLCTNGKHEEAILQYQAICPLTDVADILGLALTLFKTQKYSESFQAYEQALQLSKSDSDKSDILAAMGMVAFKSRDIDQAKTMLFKSSQNSPPSIRGLQALCALGLQSQDATLTSAVLTEVEKMNPDPQAIKTSALCRCSLLILQGQAAEAVKYMTEIVHRYPWEADMWIMLADIIIQVLPQQAGVAASCCRKGNKLKNPSKESSKLQAACDLASGIFSTKERDKNCIYSAQKAIHLYPDEISNWALLAGGLFGKKLMCPSARTSDEVLQRCIRFVSQNAKIQGSPSVEPWVALLSLWVLLYNGHFDQAIELANQYGDWCDYSEQVVAEIRVVRTLAECLKADRRTSDPKNLDAFKDVVAGTAQSSFMWQIVGGLYVSHGIPLEAESAYRQALEHSRGNQIVPLLRLAKLAIDNAQGGENEQQWLNLANEALTEVKKLRPSQQSCALLLQGLLKLQQTNQKQAKKLFQHVLNADDSIRGMASSLARYHLIKIIKEKDKAAALDILTEADKAGDPYMAAMEKLFEE